MAHPPETQSRTAAPPTNKSTAPTNGPPKTSLVIEDEEASQRQAQFSRLQAALGLRKKITEDDLKNFKYGDDLAALDDDKPTGLKRERDITLVSMELEVRRDDAGELTSIDLYVASICTSLLASESPRNFVATVRNRSHTRYGYQHSNTALSEPVLGDIRYQIQGELHPCLDEHSCNVRGSKDHAGHKLCFMNKDLIFVFSDKEATVRELKSLGCDVERDICTLDIYDLRELNSAYQARSDARTRGPMTGGRRTEIPKSDELSTRDEILKTTKCFSASGKAGRPALDVMTAAVKRAVDDGTSSGWMRTKEQIDGGPFSQPRKLLFEWPAAVALVELDLARMGPSSEYDLDYAVGHELFRYENLPVRIQTAITANTAQRHDLTQMLANIPRYKNIQQQTPQTIKLIHIATAEARVRKLIPPATDYTYQAPEVTALRPAGTTTAKLSGLDKPGNGQSLPSNLAKTGRGYQKAGRDISTRLVKFLESQLDSKTECVKTQTRSLYSTVEHTENGATTEYPKMESSGAFKTVASRARQWGWVMDDEVAGWFITAIQGRRELRNWYDLLPKDDPRSEDNQKHEAWLQTTIEVVVALAGHKY